MQEQETVLPLKPYLENQRTKHLLPQKQQSSGPILQRSPSKAEREENKKKRTLKQEQKQEDQAEKMRKTRGKGKKTIEK